MSDETEPTQTDDTKQPQGSEEQQVDWQAKYRDAIAQSRKWEDRAKASFKDSEELKKLKESQLSEAEKTAKRISELEAENQKFKQERQHAEWASKVSSETGVPAELLRGDSLDDMRSFATQLDQWAHPKPKGLPNQGKTPSGMPAKAQETAWANELFSNL